MVHRLIHKSLSPHLTNQHILMVQGARNVGKTFLMRRIDEVLKDHGFHPFYINIARERFHPTLASPKALYQYLKAEYLDGAKHDRGHVILDNIDVLPHPKEFLTELEGLGGDGLKIIAVTSTSRLNQNTNTSDLPNTEIFTYYPVSWREFIGTMTEIREDSRLSISNQADVTSFFEEQGVVLEDHFPHYLQWGGFPGVVHTHSNEERREKLHTYFDEYLHKDVSTFIRETSLPAYVSLLQTVAAHPGALLNIHSLSSQLEVHKKTIEKFLRVAQETFMLGVAEPFYSDTRRETSKMSRAYITDMGWLSLLNHRLQHAHTRRPFSRELLLNFTYTELMKKRSAKKVLFYRTIAKAQIDFIVEVEGGHIPVLLSYRKKRKRIPVVIRNFVEKYKDTACIPIVLTRDELRFTPESIFVPLTLFPFIDLDSISSYSFNK